MRCERNTVIVRCRRLHCSALRDPFGTIAIRSRNVAGGCRRRMSPPDVATGYSFGSPWLCAHRCGAPARKDLRARWTLDERPTGACCAWSTRACSSD